VYALCRYGGGLLAGGPGCKFSHYVRESHPYIEALNHDRCAGMVTVAALILAFGRECVLVRMHIRCAGLTPDLAPWGA